MLVMISNKNALPYHGVMRFFLLILLLPCLHQSVYASALDDKLNQSLFPEYSNQLKPFNYTFFFDLRSAEILPHYYAPLLSISKVLQKMKPTEFSVALHGHTDNQGGQLQNQKLSEKRALAIKNYISQRLGVKNMEISMMGFGKKKPLTSNQSVDGRAKNRRVELLITPLIPDPMPIKLGIVKVMDSSSDGKTVATSSDDLERPVKLWDVTTGLEAVTLKAPLESVNTLAFSADGHLLATGDDKQILKIWNASTGRLKKTIKAHDKAISALSFSPDDQQILTGGKDNLVKRWKVENGKLAHIYKGHTGDVYALSFSPDGNYILSGSADDTIKLWEVVSGKLLKTFVGHKWIVYDLKFSPDMEWFVSASGDKTIRKWNLLKGAYEQSFEGHDWAVLSVDVSPDGNYLVSGGKDKQVIIWDAKTGKALRTLTGHTNYVTSVKFSIDGLLIFSASLDKTVRLWNRVTGKLLRINGQPPPIAN